jgi:lipoate-protein ligase A
VESSDKTWLWLACEPANGAWNMAFDQFFAESMPLYQKPVMRVYRWRPWCLSLGYHQSSDCVNLEACRQDGIDVVRRQTGGRAVLHAEELTYSVIIPRNHPLSGSVSETYRCLSLGLAEGLRTAGVPASFQKRSIDLRSHYNHGISVSCFSAAALHEIVVGDRKLVGSAQRRLPLAIIQHGSILMGPAHLKIFEYLNGLSNPEKEQMTAEMAGKTTHIQAIHGNPPDFESLGHSIKLGMMQAFGNQFEERELTRSEKQGIEDRQDPFSVLRNTWKK